MKNIGNNTGQDFIALIFG